MSSPCVPRASQWRLVISQEYVPWEAYVYEFNAFEGTQVLNLTYSGDNCTRPGYETSNSGARAFDGVSSTSWTTRLSNKIGGWIGFSLTTPAAVTQLCAQQYAGGQGNTIKAFHVQYYDGYWVQAWDTGAVGNMGPGRVCLTSPVAACTCSNTCNYASDAECDDGGPGAEYTSCVYGTDCIDCGPRSAPPPPMSPPPTTGASAVETSGSTGIIIGVIIGVILVLVLSLVILYCRRRETRRKLIVVTPADAPPKSSSDDGTSYSHSSASSSSDMVSSLTLGEKAAPERATTEGLECSFWFVNADSLRRAATPRLPKMQTLRTQEPKRLVKKTIGFVEGISGAYKNILVVSHRWETPTDPDPDGAQALAVQAYLKEHPEIDAVWFDFSSMPQGRNKTPSESAEFKEMLPNINLLYLTCSVLILMDRSYMNRFWTQFEAYLSMRAITSDGLTNALDPKARVTIKTADDP